MEKRSITLQGHRTSLRLEPEFWRVLEQIAESKRLSLPKFIADIDKDRDIDQSLASKLRVTALRYLHS